MIDTDSNWSFGTIKREHDKCTNCEKKLVVHIKVNGMRFCCERCADEYFRERNRPDFVTKDSGEREEFTTGAKRDTRTGKGRYDLIPPKPLKRVAQLYERGAAKYDDHNWRKGMPWSRTLDSLKRHINEWQDVIESGGEMDEDHLAAVVFNTFALMEYEYTHPELNDIWQGVNDACCAEEKEN